MEAVESLRQSLHPGANQKGDVRFQFGTEYSSNYVCPPEHEYNYKPLPAVFQPELSGTGRNSTAKTALFTRLNSSADEVKSKLAPVHAKLTASLKRLDVQGSGYVNMEALETGLKETGVFLSQADVNELAGMAPRNVCGDLDYGVLLDSIVNDTVYTTSFSALPQTFEWSSDSPLAVSLRLHTTTQPYEVPAASMKQFARRLSDIRKREQDPEKVFNLIRHHLLQEMLISPGPAGKPDLSFRQWLMYNGVMARNDTHGPGVIPPEVYEVLGQVIAALGLTQVDSATQVPTLLGASLRHTNK